MKTGKIEVDKPLTSANGYTDEELLDYLEKLNKEARYTGSCILRESTTGRGWRLHETSKIGACNSVREAIKNFIKQTEGFPT